MENVCESCIATNDDGVKWLNRTLSNWVLKVLKLTTPIAAVIVTFLHFVSRIVLIQFSYMIL